MPTTCARADTALSPCLLPEEDPDPGCRQWPRMCVIGTGRRVFVAAQPRQRVRSLIRGSPSAGQHRAARSSVGTDVPAHEPGQLSVVDMLIAVTQPAQFPSVPL